MIFQAFSDRIESKMYGREEEERLLEDAPPFRNICHFVYVHSLSPYLVKICPLLPRLTALQFISWFIKLSDNSVLVEQLIKNVKDKILNLLR